jgi:hypothetical protein
MRGKNQDFGTENPNGIGLNMRSISKFSDIAIEKSES